MTSESDKVYNKRDEENAKYNEVRYGPVSIDRLQKAGIAMSDIKKLRDFGVYTIEALIRTPRKNLLNIKGLGDVKVDKMIKEGTSLVYTGFQAASFLLVQRKEIIQITTGSKKLDELLDGGVEANSITEIFGEFRCGKTQLCHTLAVTCQLPVARGGAEGKCLFIDTEGSFRPERLVQIAKRYGLDPVVTLNNVACARATNSDHQTQLLVTAAGLFSESRFACIIVDSATALYRCEYDGRSELNARQNHLGRFLRGLQKLADEFGLVTVVTNQVVASNLDSNTSFMGPSNKPIGGNIMAHSVTTRLSMTKGKGENRKVKIVASPNIPERDVEVKIGDGGIQDSIPSATCEE
jgi:DNA repair protein RAD51